MNTQRTILLIVLGLLSAATLGVVALVLALQAAGVALALVSAGLLAHAVGLGVPAFGLTVLMLTAALPSASNVSLLAERYEADNGRIARIIMTSTVLAFASFTALAWVLGAQPAA